ncbi:pseudouridine synthase [Rubrivivax benzoatilyticus]|uniref:Pseudouridine synthase n=2 Tax=Rubrivivax benzoatilyticus TaxID=316997 RepID=A0ABX0HTC9_9BURK|nr:pseudouridine synthase [Rubrivivax benzoatilyticus]NHK98267.1 rRNA pseudouridine synthase [Rubrivivax benzoatilyticus]NHL23958.1 rRNA pseudouridine synthase [Rubrivivax benzoatilyticus]
MSSNDAESTPDPIAAAPAAEEAAPKKRRAPRKKAEAPAAEVAPAAEAAPAPEAPAPEVAAEPAAEAKPRRRRTTKKDAAAETPLAEPAAFVESLPAAAAERAPESAPQLAEAPVRSEAPAAAEPVAEPAGEGAESAPAEAGAEADAPRRGRNRRRGRRGGDRGERAPRDAAAPAAEGDAAAGDDEAAEAAEAAAPAPQLPPADVGEVFASVLSGSWDAEAGDEAPPLPAKRVLAPEPDAPKLHKVLAQAGIGSRRDMEQMILEGRITVNGEPAHIGQRIAAGDRIAVGGKPVRYRIAPPPTRVIAYHKPAGEVVTHDDPQQRPTVFRRLPRLHQGKWQSVGRLDINTEGLLLFTNSGELANQLMHPRFGIEREYAVRSLGGLDDASRQKLLEGVEIDGQRCAFKSIENGGGEGANQWYRCVITEGRNREVRKLFDAVGHAVSRLIRIRYGSVVLPKGLKRGVWVDLSEQDVRTLRRMTGVGERPEGEAREAREAGGDRRGKRGKRGRGGNAPEGAPRAARPQRREGGEGPAIPNPLQQTFDKRAIQQERQRKREIPEDGPIPNPLQQTYDKRGLQRERPVRDFGEDGPIPNPLQQTYDKRFVQKPKPLAGGRGARGPKKGGAGGQPDPMQTSVGYIGGDAFLRKGSGGGGRGGSRGGRGGGGGGGGGGRRGGR